MNSRGFTLIELLVVIAIMATLMTIATLNWQSMSMKNEVEGQIRAVHADMMSVRLDALYTKRSRCVVFSGKTFKVYSSSVTSVTPLSTRTFKYNFISPPGNGVASSTVTFDTGGMATAAQNTFCIDPYNDTTATNGAVVDSIVISQARINLGKRDGDCDSDHVTQK